MVFMSCIFIHIYIDCFVYIKVYLHIGIKCAVHVQAFLFRFLFNRKFDLQYKEKLENLDIGKYIYIFA